MKKRMLRIKSTIVDPSDSYKEDENDDYKGENYRFDKRASASEIGEKLDIIFGGLNGAKRFSQATKIEPLKHYMSPKVINNNLQTMSSEEIVAFNK